MGVFMHISYVLDGTVNLHELFLAHMQLYSIFTHLLYSMFSSAYILIILQSSAVIFSIYYILKLAQKDFKNIFLIIFLLSYAVWYNFLFDFHFDHLSILFIFAFYYFIKEQKYKSAFFISILVSFIKEPFALVTSFMGIYMIVKSKQYIKGTLLFIYGLVYFYIVTHYVIPFFTPDYGVIGSGAYVSFGAGGSLVDIALYPIVHFKEFLIDIITTKKIIYLIALLTAFGLVVVFFSPLELIPAIPPLAIAMLSNVENYYWYNTHYTAPLVAPFMVAFIYGFPKFIKFCQKYIKYLDSENKILIAVFIPIILSHIIFSPSPISRFFWIDKLPQYHYSTYLPTERTEIIKEAIKQYIPSDENISVSSQNSLNWDYLANREYYFAFPLAVLKEHEVIFLKDTTFIDIFKHVITQDKSIIKTKKIRVDYVVIDFKRALYLIDKSVSQDDFINVVERMKEDYKAIYQYDGFFIYKKDYK
jgi:uncharacterized membrane protein